MSSWGSYAPPQMHEETAPCGSLAAWYRAEAHSRKPEVEPQTVLGGICERTFYLAITRARLQCRVLGYRVSLTLT